MALLYQSYSLGAEEQIMSLSRLFQSEHSRSRSTRPALALVIVLILAVAPLPGGAPAHAGTTLNVCPVGCTYATIQDAVYAASPTDTISVGPGTYTENVVIGPDPLTLVGAGQGATIIRPASSNPDCGGLGGGSLCTGSSTIILVEANNVTISDLTLDGDNPTIDSGHMVGGADVDARNGIVTNHLLDQFDNLSVHDVTVKNTYLRGINASSGGSFVFDHNTVRNVQGESASVGIFNFRGAGTISNNSVAATHDAIAAEQSRGVQVLNNTIITSGSGIHTDNAGQNGGAADLIQGNHVSDCTVNGQGVRVLTPHIAPVVRQNSVTGCDAGLAAYGHGKMVATSFSANEVDGAGHLDSAGILISTSQLDAGSSNVAVALSNNNFKNVSTTLSLEAQSTFSIIITATENAFNANARKGILKFGSGASTITAARNWWASPTGPTAPDNIGGTGVAIPEAVGFDPWLCDGVDGSAEIGFQPDPTNLCNATPPDTQIAEKPADPNTSGTIRFAFAGSDDVTPAAKLSFECQADGAAFAPCVSPKTYTTLGVGAHSFAVRAKDPAGKTDATPATYAWTQAVPPLTLVYLPMMHR